MIDIYCFILALGSARSLVRIHLSPLLCFLQTSFRGPKSRLELTREVLYRVKNAFNLNLYSIYKYKLLSIMRYVQTIQY